MDSRATPSSADFSPRDTREARSGSAHLNPISQVPILLLGSIQVVKLRPKHWPTAVFSVVSPYFRPFGQCRAFAISRPVGEDQVASQSGKG